MSCKSIVNTTIAVPVLVGLIRMRAAREILVSKGFCRARTYPGKVPWGATAHFICTSYAFCHSNSLPNCSSPSSPLPRLSWYYHSLRHCDTARSPFWKSCATIKGIQDLGTCKPMWCSYLRSICCSCRSYDSPRGSSASHTSTMILPQPE